MLVECGRYMYMYTLDQLLPIAQLQYQCSRSSSGTKMYCKGKDASTHHQNDPARTPGHQMQKIKNKNK